MLGKILRIVGIILLGLTAVITLMGGIGTTCVALDAAKYEMDGIVPFQWLYILYVLAGVVIGIMGVWATVGLVKGKGGAYRLGLIALVLGLLTGGLHMATSRTLRGGSMPTDFVVYATVLTLIVFLFFRIPGIWNKINIAGQDDDVSGMGAGIAMIVGGIATLTGQYWAGSNHTINGINYAEYWHTQFMIVGWLAVLAGAVLVGANLLEISFRPLLRRTIRTELPF